MSILPHESCDSEISNIMYGKNLWFLSSLQALPDLAVNALLTESQKSLLKTQILTIIPTIVWLKYSAAEKPGRNGEKNLNL